MCLAPGLISLYHQPYFFLLLFTGGVAVWDPVRAL